MSALLIRRRAAAQPTGTLQVDTTHPDAASLVDVWVPGLSSRGLLSNLEPTGSPMGSTRATAAGLGFNPTTRGRLYPTLPSGKPLAWLVIAHRNTSAANSSIIRSDGTMSPMQEWDGQVRAGYFNNGGGFVSAVNYGPVADFAGKVSTFCGVLSPGENVIFSNGRSNINGPAQGGSFLGVGGSGTAPFCIGGTESNGEIATGWTVVFAAVWQGYNAPTSARLRDLERNSWQLLKAPSLRLYAPDSVADTSITGSATAQASAAGTLGTSIPLTAGAAAVASAVGTLSTSVRLAGAGVSTASAVGALSTSILLTGAAVAQAGASASFTGDAAALTGTAGVVATSAASLATSVRLVGAAVGQVGASGALSTTIGLTGAAVARASTAADLAGGAATLTGAALGQSAAAGALSTGIALTGAAIAQAGASGSVVATGATLTGAAAASAGASGTLLSTIRMSGLGTASASASASFVGSAVALSGAAAARAGAAGDLSTVVALAGAAGARAAGTAALLTYVRLMGTGVARATAIASIEQGIRYARAPAGSGYTSHTTETQLRPTSASTARPAATQRNDR
jgi:hypothetical protein